MGKKRPGVQARAKTIQIWFPWEGKRCWETLDWLPTDANLDRAARWRKRIVQEIEVGVFDYAAHFPNSPKAKQTGSPPFFDVAEDYLAQYADENTRQGYRDALNRSWSGLFELPINQIDYSDFIEPLSRLQRLSAKYHNNELIPLRGVFKLAKKRKLIADNPADELEPRKKPKSDPDPFTAEEREAIIKWMYGKGYGPYFETAFWTGLRNPSEMIALIRPNVGETIRVGQRRSRGELKRGGKMGVVREVYINDRARNALDQTGDTDYVFVSPHTGEPYKTGGPLNDIWRQCLASLGIRHRKMYNTRHTYATTMLEAGVNPAVAAEQMGHSLKMFFEVYAKWINATRRAEELQKLRNVSKNVSEGPEVKPKLLKLK